MAVVEHQALTICGDGTRYAPHLGTKAPNKDAQHHFVYVPKFAQGRYIMNIFGESRRRLVTFDSIDPWEEL